MRRSDRPGVARWVTARRGWVAIVIFLVSVLAPSQALADPAGPTDYRSEVVGIDPPTPSIDVQVIGGDSFVQLTATPGTEVVVIGYRGEETLWIRPDGTVWENRNSPSTWLNEERYGTDYPDDVTVDSPPDWREIGAGGRWSWHDHRAHWMQESRPLAAEPGDQILEAVVPLYVDGVEVDVTVMSTWLPEPSPVPAWLGAGLGVGLVLVAWGMARRRPHRWMTRVAAPVATLALVAGAVQYRSLPPETGPRLVWWALPAVALGVAVAAEIVTRRETWFWTVAAELIVGIELALWGWIRRDGLTAAIVPTDLPGWLDRFATALALTAGVSVIVGAVSALVRPPVSGSTARTG